MDSALRGGAGENRLLATTTRTEPKPQRDRQAKANHKSACMGPIGNPAAVDVGPQTVEDL